LKLDYDFVVWCIGFKAVMVANLPPAVKAIFFSEFHHEAGPVLTYQAPDNFLSKEVFDVVHVFIITKPQLYRKIITVSAVNLKILGCPQSIEDKKYKRNALLFNFGFVFDPSAETTAFQPVVKKLSGCFRTLELESSFLSRSETRSQLPSILAKVLTELNSKGFCSVLVDEVNTIHLKVIPEPPETVLVHDHDVPIFCIDNAEINSTPWDLTIKQIMPYIDGFNHILMIATQADVDVSLVQLCVQHLLHYGAIKLISVFQYSNVYMTTPSVSLLKDSPKLAAECLRFITKQGRPQPSIREIFALYCALGPGVTVKDWCLRHEPQSLGINERSSY
jgi:hypothetical protein